MQQRLAIASVFVLVLLAGASAFLIETHALTPNQSAPSGTSQPTVQQTQANSTTISTTMSNSTTTSTGSGSLLTNSTQTHTGGDDGGDGGRDD